MLLPGTCCVTAPPAIAAGADVVASVNPVTNGDGFVGQITRAGEIDTLTFSATAGDYVALSVGEVSGTPDFTPWVRLIGLTGALIASDYGSVVAQASARVSKTGTYKVLVGSNDSGNNDTCTYRLTLVKGSGATVALPGDQEAR